MKPLTVQDLKAITAGHLVQGSEEVLIQHGAYRLKQVKRPNTALFTNKPIVNWKDFESLYPIVLVTDRLYSQKEIPEQIIIIKVNDIDEAYWKFINFYRNQFNIPIVAITGTSGKSTTKEMIKHILSAEKNVVSTPLSSNSRTASLQYLLNIDDDTDAAVFETAVGSPGDITLAGEYFKPTIGIITNIGAHHLNYCKTLEGYIQAKGEMLDIISPTGSLILNDDDSNTSNIDLSKFQGRIIKVGKHQSCDFRASNIRYYKNGMLFNVHHKKKLYEIYVPGFGEHQVYNALAAIAAIYEMGLPISLASKQLQSFRKLNKQLQVFKGINNSVLIDDTWNITTTSLEAGLKVLNALGEGKKKIAIIGTITDLGSWGYIIHEQAGELIAQIGVDVLITIGEHASIMAVHAIEEGLTSPVHIFKNSTLVYKLLDKLVDENTIIFIKGDMYSKEVSKLADDLKLKKSSTSE
ncbi:UDP-N-acetylmuramoyl-tripeptide--D-alanyl-D-alanine ligase [Lysinibacillus xylanilyticus]|uniref:UDP-N-acetylmuramoyl-tripeptide--D-alanyl-D-alanine ligase n=1 Tax=Lysinibacillus xylanilyticus TaxID=582475 RepID=A0ABT4EL10_9BACI|nr:UDP-N-acetylmuramoyl-tripeptide--D-alanyl-D-alanine ligase [Lysinibacillus xylanilyticus]MCY9546375.1 UDP-N-acetylmuramoyl-tripeptide--D-alanyl-D-alanine ligase [Lysinibacillus xylanilyticus]MED3802392.1 UDP-N-acetylmuramoyl-tripeptide--D-alanyl-D-alanine ligase [Lysinibacillus xylanilyticus]